MNILVTGGLGFIASNFCVNTKFDKLIIIDRNDYCSNMRNIDEIIHLENVVLIEKDIVDCDLIEIFNTYNINYLIHFAAQTHVQNSYNMLSDFIQDNIIATCTLLEACKQYNKMEKILVASTDEVLGPSLNNKLFESSVLNPTNPYSASKASAEMFINCYIYSYKLPIIMFRSNNVYGPKQYIDKVIPLFVTQILNNEPITIHGDGSKSRDFIYVDDVCSAINTILLKGTVGEIYNISIDNAITIKNLALYLTNYMNKPINIKYIEDRAFNDDRYYINSDKLKLLGWKPTISFDEGIIKTIDWILKHGSEYWEKDSKLVHKSIDFFQDNRGELKFLNNSKMRQQFISYNDKNVIRGIHTSPYGKTIICLKGKIIDYVINLSNYTYEKVILNENSKIYIPPHHGHLFISLENDTQILYQLEGIYDPQKEININYRCPYINLDIPFNQDYILSDKDNSHSFCKPVDYIVLGANGFLGSYTCKVLQEQNKNFITLDTRLENKNLLSKQLSIYKPKYVICAAGISGKPTVKWCETNQKETFHINYTLQVQLAEICRNLNIHLTIYGSGLVYKNKGIYNELDEPNNDDLYYSKIRIMLEKTLKDEFSNVLYLRILYPISGNGHEKCFLSKIKSRLNTTHDIKINCTVLPDLIPCMLNLIENNETGIYNFVNPGLIAIPDLIKLVDNKLQFNIIKKNIDFPELDVSKLLQKCPSINNIYDACEKMISKTYKITTN